MVLPNWERTASSLARVETPRRLSVIAIGLKRYELKRRRAAESIRLLTPEILADVPDDPMSGEPLCFEQKSGEQTWLYSVGENGRDEGGKGDDLVWPAREPA